MKPTQNTRYLLQWTHWLNRSLWWRTFDHHCDICTNTARLMAGWVKIDIAKWRAATFQ